MEEEEERGPEEGFLLVRIHVPELNVQKCLQFPRDQLVWDVKQQCLAALPKELKESFNYGLFSPPENGRAGKFLDEERRLGDYPFNSHVGYLELKYKRRVYKMLSVDEKQLKSLHTRANLKRFLDYVTNGQVEKITKMCSKGLDPNFHCQESGETPLTIATKTKKPAKVLIALVNGGALLDYRTKDGSTAMHRSIEHKNLEAMKTLLELGASPNYKDGKGLTPLYLTITQNCESQYTETLLHDHATIGAQDLQGWQEVHQACRTGLSQHLEQLLFYGANMNARNASGNTPLHICAVFNQESCARQLLFRGADRQALNYANQTPYQVAVIAGNMELAEIIQNFRNEDVVLALGVTEKSLGDTSDIVSDSSGVGTANSDTTNGSVSLPGTTVVCTESYSSKLDGHLNIREGDIIEVTGATDDGYLEGTIKTGGCKSGLFPSHCVQEVRLRHHNIQAPMMIALDSRMPARPGSGRVAGRRECTSSTNAAKQFATAPRLKRTYVGFSVEPRTVVLHRGRKGFGFILRGAKATSPLMELTPSEKCPALQYLDDVDPGGVADRAGLKKGDFLLEINNEDVSSASHEHVVDLIRKSGDLVSMTVVSLGPPVLPGSLPMSKSTAGFPGGNTEHINKRQCATLPRKSNYQSSGVATIGRSIQAPLPPRRDPKTTLSVGRARAKSLVAGLEAGGEKEADDLTKSSSAESVHQQVMNISAQARTASIRQRPISNRITTLELEELFQRQKGETGNKQGMMGTSNFQSGYNTLSHPGSPAKSSGRVYASVAEMKRSKNKNVKVRFQNMFSEGPELRRNFHSTPDLANQEAYNEVLIKHHRSQDDVDLIGVNRNQKPPPTHPPPPPPVGQVIKVDISKTIKSEYGNLNNKDISEEGIVSSFKPTASAKLYASPEDMKTVGYRSRSVSSQIAKNQLRKSHSMKSNINTKAVAGAVSSSRNMNPYAQPIRASRSHSTVGTTKERKKRVFLKDPSNNSLILNKSPPPIPEPDYSCSGSENESGDEQKAHGKFPSRLPTVHLQPVENSGNSNASGSSSSGSASMPHSISVEEIQRGRIMLKSSKSYPDDFLKKMKDIDPSNEDADNSSSGVSSDQELPPGPSLEFGEGLSHEHPGPELSTKLQRHQTGLSRNAVSLSRLPPPLEQDPEEKEEFRLPPPPEFDEAAAVMASASASEAVLEPPPQFSDNRQVTRVRIVGAVPKANSPPINTPPKFKQGRLHSQ